MPCVSPCVVEVVMSEARGLASTSMATEFPAWRVSRARTIFPALALLPGCLLTCPYPPHLPIPLRRHGGHRGRWPTRDQRQYDDDRDAQVCWRLRFLRQPRLRSPRRDQGIGRAGCATADPRLHLPTRDGRPCCRPGVCPGDGPTCSGLCACRCGNAGV